MSVVADGLRALGLTVLTADDLSGRDPGEDPGNLGAGIAVRARSLDDVVACVLWCGENRVSIVPHGGRTGLAGAARSSPGQIVLMLDAMNTIEEIDADARLAVVQAGVTLEALGTAASQHGLGSGIDLGARGSCTIGGMIATNAGGIEAFQNGVMRHQVLGLETVLADGSVMSDLKRVIKANEGYDIKQLFIGAEGTIGVVTRAVVRLEPMKAAGATAVLALESAADAVAVFRAVHARVGLRLRAAEIMWRDYVAAAVAELKLETLAGLADHGVALLLEIEGADDDELADILSEPFESGWVTDALLAKNAVERDAMWLLREDSLAPDRAYPHGLWFDVSVPLGAIDAYMTQATDRIKAIDPAFHIFAIGHLGDGNLHLSVTRGTPAEDLYGAVCEALYDGLTEAGGSFSAEHGIGIEKRAALGRFGDPAKVAMMRVVKKAFDPLGIMNPGKVLPDNTA